MSQQRRAVTHDSDFFAPVAEDYYWTNLSSKFENKEDIPCKNYSWNSYISIFEQPWQSVCIDYGIRRAGCAHSKKIVVLSNQMSYPNDKWSGNFWRPAHWPPTYRRYSGALPLIVNSTNAPHNHPGTCPTCRHSARFCSTHWHRRQSRTDETCSADRWSFPGIGYCHRRAFPCYTCASDSGWSYRDQSCPKGPACSLLLRRCKYSQKR